VWKHDKEAIAAVEQFNMTVDDILGDEGKFGPDYCMSMLEFLERRVKEEIEFFSRLLKPKEA
jgi:hypothetical protein